MAHIAMMCPGRAMYWDGQRLEIDQEACLHCMYCINKCPYAIRPGDDRGVAIQVGGKLRGKYGPLMTKVLDALRAGQPTRLPRGNGPRRSYRRRLRRARPAQGADGRLPLPSWHGPVYAVGGRGTHASADGRASNQRVLSLGSRRVGCVINNYKVTTQAYEPLRRFTSEFWAGSVLVSRELLYWQGYS